MGVVVVEEADAGHRDDAGPMGGEPEHHDG
jgi:hypothetical protein